MKALKRNPTYFLLLPLCLGLLVPLLWIGRDLTNPYVFEDSYKEVSARYGEAVGEALKLAKFTGVVGLVQYSQGKSLLQVSEDRMLLLNAAIQGQTQYLEVLRLQLAMQHMKYDFLEKDLLYKQEELERLVGAESTARLPATSEQQ